MELRVVRRVEWIVVRSEVIWRNGVKCYVNSGGEWRWSGVEGSGKRMSKVERGRFG